MHIVFAGVLRRRSENVTVKKQFEWELSIYQFSKRNIYRTFASLNVLNPAVQSPA